MQRRFRASRKALGCVEEYLHDRSQSVCVNNSESANMVRYCGLGFLKDQSVASRFSFTMLRMSARSSANIHHVFADDMQCLCCGREAEVPEIHGVKA